MNGVQMRPRERHICDRCGQRRAGKWVGRFVWMGRRGSARPSANYWICFQCEEEHVSHDEGTGAEVFYSDHAELREHYDINQQQYGQ